LIEENGYSLLKINNAAYMPFKLALWEFASDSITAYNFLFLSYTTAWMQKVERRRMPKPRITIYKKILFVLKPLASSEWEQT